jgi:hypothetical protein
MAAGKQREDDLVRELLAHFELEAAEERESGVPPKEAQHALRNDAAVRADVRLPSNGPYGIAKQRPATSGTGS